MKGIENAYGRSAAYAHPESVVILQLRYSGNITSLTANASWRDDKCMCCPTVWLKKSFFICVFLGLLVIFSRSPSGGKRENGKKNSANIQSYTEKLRKKKTQTTKTKQTKILEAFSSLFWASRGLSGCSVQPWQREGCGHHGFPTWELAALARETHQAR